jgi:hypothetical protein
MDERGYTMAASDKIQTQPMKVLVTTDDYEIRGLMHIKPGGYQSRISDLLNVRDLHYIAITQATYRSLKRPDEPTRKAWTLIVRLDSIKMVVPEDGQDNVPPEMAAAQA